MTKKILITGSEGFIGNHLKEHLRTFGDYELILFDTKLNCFQDVMDGKAVKAFVAANRPDIVIHLAANPDISKSVEHTHTDLALNTGGTINMLEAVRDLGIELFILASTAQVYGEPKYTQMDENHPINPKSPYAISKNSAERYCEFYHQKYGVPYTIFRFFNIYGPNQPDIVVVPALLRKISAAEEKLEMFGSKEDSRDFVYVKDLCKAISLAIERKPVGEIINLGSGKETTIYSLAQKIANVLGKDMKFVYSDNVETAKITRMCANVEKAKQLLSWEARTELEEGIIEVAKKAGHL